MAQDRIIAVDIDDTLYSFRDAAIGAMAEMLMDPSVPEDQKEKINQALYTPWSQWRTPHDMLGQTWLDIINVVHDDEKILRQQPYQHAVHVMQALADSGNRFIYISNRATETERATREWLYDSGFPIGPRLDHKLVCTAGDKRPYIEECQYLIDDRVKTLVQFVSDPEWGGCRKAFGLLKEYNENLTDVPGIKLAPTWSGLALFFEREGLLNTPVLSVINA